MYTENTKERVLNFTSVSPLLTGEGVEAEADGGAEGEVRGRQEETVGHETREKVQADLKWKYNLYNFHKSQ